MEMILAAVLVAGVIIAILAFTIFKWSKSLLINCIVLILVAAGLFSLRSTQTALWGIFTLAGGLLYLGSRRSGRK